MTDVFGTSDVYEAYPPADAKILMRGQVLKGMTPGDQPASYDKKRATDKATQKRQRSDDADRLDARS